MRRLHSSWLFRGIAGQPMLPFAWHFVSGKIKLGGGGEFRVALSQFNSIRARIFDREIAVEEKATKKTRRCAKVKSEGRFDAQVELSRITCTASDYRNFISRWLPYAVHNGLVHASKLPDENLQCQASDRFLVRSLVTILILNLQVFQQE